jgi:hypothetical protein
VYFSDGLEATVMHVQHHDGYQQWYTIDYIDSDGKPCFGPCAGQFLHEKPPADPTDPPDDAPDPPAEPPETPKKKRKPDKLTPHTEMKNAIVAAFGWEADDVANWGLVNDVSKKLRAVHVTPDEVADLYKFTKRALPDDSTFGPGALPNRVPDWRKSKRNAYQFAPDSDFAPPSLKPTVTRKAEAAA